MIFLTIDDRFDDQSVYQSICTVTILGYSLPSTHMGLMHIIGASPEKNF